MSLKALAAAAAMMLSPAKADDAHVADWREHVHPVQREFLEDLAPVAAYLAGRRHGKTEAFAVRLINSVRDRPGSRSLYLTLTAKNARLLFLPALQKAAQRLGLRLRTNNVLLVVTFEGGGEIILGGCDDLSEAEKWRGFAWELAIVDECGAIRPRVLRYLYDDVLEPSMLDFGGHLVFGGTPGPTLAGPWYEMTGPESASTVSVHRGTIYDNPYIDDVAGKLERLRERRGWSETHPTFLREYLGMWVRDEGALVYPFDPARNSFSVLPTTTPTGLPLAASQWRHCIAVDVGYTHSASFTVVAVHPLLADDFVIRSHKRAGMLVGEYAKEVRELLEEYPGATVVMDMGGMGKQHGEELRRRYALPIHAADKREKKSAVQIARDRTIAGRLKLADGPECDDLRDEMAVLGWDKTHSEHHPDQEDHCCDGLLYALRRLRNFTDASPDPPPVPGTLAHARAEEARMIEALEKRIRGNRHRARYDA